MTLGHYLGRQQTCRNLQHICQGCFGYWLFNEKRNIFSDCHSGRLGWPIILRLWKYVTGSWHDIGTKRQWQNSIAQKLYKFYCLWFPKAACLLLCPPLSWIELNRIECLHTLETFPPDYIEGFTLTWNPFFAIFTFSSLWRHSISVCCRFN